VNENDRIGRLCVITDTAIQSRFSHQDLTALAVEGGADTIQLRDKTLPDAELVRVARMILEVCHGHDVKLVVNDRVGVARDAGAHGVHLGLTDALIADARAVLGPSAIIGGTAGTVEQALAAEAAGATYIGCGHVFPTTSKQKAGEPIGLDGLARVCEAVRIPVVAIGGIDATNARSCIDAGAHGVAVIAAVCAASDPREAARRIRYAIAD
jgi:thiamine-phosphate pyrophosphorylase